MRALMKCPLNKIVNSGMRLFENIFYNSIERCNENRFSLYKLSFVFLFVLFTHISYGALPNDSILKVFDYELDNRYTYYERKEDVMHRMKQQLRLAGDLNARFELSDRLYNEYIVYQYDSAWVYAQNTLSIAKKLNDEELIAKSNLNILKSLVLAGLYKEAFELINMLEPQKMSQELRIRYNENCLRFYQDLLIYSRSEPFQKEYAEKIAQYSDALMKLLKPYSFEYDYYSLINYTDDNKRIEKYLKILDQYKLSPHEYAFTYSNLSVSYHRINDLEKAVYYAALSSIYDIRNSIRETTSKYNLGQWMYELGNIDFASKAMQAAMDDAKFYDNRSRKIEISSFLPIVELERHEIIENQKDRLAKMLIVISVLALVSLLMLVVILRQIIKLRSAKVSIQNQYSEISEINSKLEEINRELEYSQQMLIESNEELNEIKDMYIVQLLYGKSEYIERFESLFKTIDRKVVAKQYDDLRRLYKEFNFKREREDMYSSFDKTFLLLFPNFIEQFNAFFDVEDQVTLDKDGGLTPELRIFALIRLGITDNEQIARFLNISVKTVYSYKGRLKSKTIIPKEEFEYRVRRILKN